MTCASGVSHVARTYVPAPGLSSHIIQQCELVAHVRITWHHVVAASEERRGPWAVAAYIYGTCGVHWYSYVQSGKNLQVRVKTNVLHPCMAIVQTSVQHQHL